MEDPLIGAVVASRYRVESLLGRGGMGAVYRVRHLKMRRRFALKRLIPELSKDVEAVARFHREANLIAGFRHPNIVEIVDWETLEDGSPCMIMELLEGEDLASFITKTKKIPWSTVLKVGNEILAAISVAHRAGVVHRDIKPQNIFLSRDDSGSTSVKLLDFGISKVKSATIVTDAAYLLGTPSYMSPEQADASKAELVGPATDVWAVGALLFEMATGKLAFPGINPVAILYKICHEGPREFDRDDVPAAFVTLVKRALSRGSDRIETADELRAGLDAALSNLQDEASILGNEDTVLRSPPVLTLVSAPVPTIPAPIVRSQTIEQRHSNVLPWMGVVLAGIILGLSIAAVRHTHARIPPVLQASVTTTAGGLVDFARVVDAAQVEPAVPIPTEPPAKRPVAKRKAKSKKAPREEGEELDP